MVKESFNTETRPIYGRTYGTTRSSGQTTDAEEPHDARMKLSPVITNIGISLLVMVLFAIAFHI
jgi:hypothetical protein